MQDNTKEFDLYVKGRDYNNKLSPPYYQTVTKNYRFYTNDQWHGVKANGLPTPVFNIIQQIINYKIQSILSSNIKMQFSVQNIADNTQIPEEQNMQKLADMISGFTDVKWETLKMDSLNRDALLDGALSGDMCYYTYWDPSIDSGQTNGQETGEDGQARPVKIMGDFVTELVDGANIMFGNPNDTKVQNQPYILIAGRKLVSELMTKAKNNKQPQTEIDKIVGDNDYDEQPGDRGKVELDNNGEDSSKCLYLIKLWKDKGKVMMKMVTKSAVIQNDTDTGLTLYPIAWANWTKIKNSYHGQAECTGLIPNQILINQMFAMIAYFMRMQAFGKVIYDRTRITSWTNAIGSAIGVDGEVNNAVQQLQPGQMNVMIMNAFDNAVKTTKDLAGANDSALGNVDPKNTSAIIVTQKQSAIPLEGIKANLYQFIEDLGYIWLDFMLHKYNVDRKISYKVGSNTQIGTFNAEQAKNISFKLKIDVGPSSYWSEISSMQTLDNLLQNQQISFLQYLERIPNGIIPKKQELIDELQAQNQDQQFMFEQMAKFVDTLPPQIQQQLEQLRQKDPQEYENTVKQMMSQQGQMPDMQQNQGGMING